MRNLKINILASVVVIFAFMALAIDKAVVVARPPVKPPVVVDKEALIVQRIAEIQADKTELATTVYSGTMSQILTARVADVNAVHVKATAIIEDANAVMKEKGIIIHKREMIVEALAKDAETVKRQKENAEFIKSVSEGLDPCNLDAKDPNYLIDLENNAETLRWILDCEIIKPI
jgi:hypothetical protein